MTTAILFAAFFSLLVLGLPIAFSIGLSTVIVLITSVDASLIVIPQKISVALSGFSLIGIPFFILAGEIMEKSGITQKLVDLSKALIGWVTGGLTYVSVLTGMLLGGISGSGVADTAALGSIMIPSMKKEGYPVAFAAALQAASGSIGVIIPPSITMIVLGGITNISVAKLFMAGVFPGILVGFLFMFFSFLITKKNGYGVNDKIPFTLKRLGKSFISALLPLLAPVIIIGGILGGIFTATEASVVAVAYTLFIGMFVYRTISLKDLKRILINTVRSTANVLIIIGLSASFGWLLTYGNFSQQISHLVMNISTNEYIILLLINLVFFIGGMFLEGGALIIMFVPILMPIATQAGVDPLLFCVLITMNIVIGQLTPPVGVCLYVASGISGSKLEDISKNVIPFIGAIVLVMLLCVLIPPLVDFLPGFVLT